MSKIQCDISKCFCLIFIVAYIGRSVAKIQPNTTNLNGFDFEQMKKDLFTQHTSNNFYLEDISSNDLVCLSELAEIGSGLIKKQIWALKSKFLFLIDNHD